MKTILQILLITTYSQVIGQNIVSNGSLDGLYHYKWRYPGTGSTDRLSEYLNGNKNRYLALVVGSPFPYGARLLPMCLICSSAITTLLACELQKANQQPIKEKFSRTKITIATLLRGDETLKDAPALNKSVNWHNNYFFSIFYAKPSIFPLISHCK